MQAVGLVAEYNPFHNGHLYHLQQAKELSGSDVTVVVMSGNWLQRGEPAIMDKWVRAQLALNQGADLVVELPVFEAVQPAHLFAKGAVELLSALNCQSLVFGAEHPELDFERLVAAFPQDRQQFRRYDATYATLFNEAMQAATGQSLTAANDLLGFSYYLANVQLGRPLKLMPIQRQVAGHGSQNILDDHFASATAIRSAALRQDWSALKSVVPSETLTALQQQPLVSWDAFWPQVKYQVMTASTHQQGQIYQMAEGLEHRFREQAQMATSVDDLLKRVKTKRFTYSRLQRVLTADLLQLTADEVNQAAKQPYLRVLGFSSLGQAYLHSVKKQLPLPLFTKINQQLRKQTLALDYRAGKVYQLATGIEQDLFRRPIMVAR